MIVIDYNAKSGRFIIQSPPWEVGRMRALPNRRWDAKSKVWTAPAIRANISHIQSEMKDASITNAAQTAIEESSWRRVRESNKLVTPDKFPAWYGFKTKPYNHQRKALGKLYGSNYAALFMDMGCLSGDTMLKVCLRGKTRNVTIKYMYDRYASKVGTGKGYRCRSLMGDRFGQNEILKIWKTGTKECVRVTLEDGKYVESTPDHKYLTVDGWKEAQHLTTADRVLTNGREGFVDKDGYVRVHRRGHPNAWKSSGQMYEHVWVMSERLGRPLISGEVVHHINRIKTDNRIENLELTDSKSHGWSHDSLLNMDGGVSPVSGGKIVLIPKHSKVVSVVPVGLKETYDLTMNESNQNYVANGVVVHNTGKTKTFIDMHCAYRAEDKVDAVVIVCPKSVRRTWEHELKVHATIEYSVHILDTAKQKQFDEWVASSHPFKWLVVGTQSLATGRAASMVERFLLTTCRASMLVDESHLIKTHNANRSKECVRLGKMAERRYIGTGTYIANSPMDAFMQFEFLDSDIIGVGDYYSFRNRYAVMGGYEGKQIIGYQNMDELIELISPFIFECKKSDVLDLPPKVYETREVELSKEHMAMYKQLAKNKYVETSEGVMTVQTALEKMLRLQEMVSGIIAYENPNGPAKYTKKLLDVGEHPKVAEVLDIADSTDESMIIWCVYRPEIEMVVKALREKYGDDQVVELHGGIDVDQRHHNVNEVFQKKKARFLVGNAATGGVGLTITAATVEVYFSNSFNYIDRVQSEDRAHRSGQTKSVTIIDLIAKNTVDEVVYEALSNKQDVSDFVKTKVSDTIKRLSLA